MRLPQYELALVLEVDYRSDADRPARDEKRRLSQFRRRSNVFCLRCRKQVWRDERSVELLHRGFDIRSHSTAMVSGQPRLRTREALPCWVAHDFLGFHSVGH